MPKIVIMSDPATWAVTVMPAAPYRWCCKSVTTSAENVEKVVRAPRKPVMTSKRHSGGKLTVKKTHGKADNETVYHVCRKRAQR